MRYCLCAVLAFLLTLGVAYGGKTLVPLRCMRQINLEHAKNCHDVSPSEMSCDNVLIHYTCITANPYELQRQKLVCKPEDIPQESQ